MCGQSAVCENGRDMAKNPRELQKRRARQKHKREVSLRRRVGPKLRLKDPVVQNLGEDERPDGYRDPWDDWTGTADAYTETWAANPYEMMRRTDGLSGPGARVSLRTVLSLPEAVLLERLTALRLTANAQMFHRYIRPLGSAWGLPHKLWPTQVVQLHPSEQDFVAATCCALWSIWFPSIPSSETIVDTMLEFRRAARRRHADGAVECWARMWALVSPHLDGIQTEDDLEKLLNGFAINPRELVTVAKAIHRKRLRDVRTALGLLEAFHAALVPDYLDDEDPDEAGEYRLQYAFVLNRAGYPERAEEVIAKQLEVAPDSPWGYFAAADFFIERGSPEDFARAREMVERAAKLDDAPEDAIEDYRRTLA